MSVSTSDVSTSQANIIRIACAMICNERGEMLVVRKRGTSTFMQPGGKIEPGEEASAALARELLEEIAVVADPAAMTFLGCLSAPAANEPGWIVEAQLFAVPHTGAPVACAEIEAIRWVDPVAPGDLVLAPLTRDAVLPLCARGHERPRT